MKTDASMQRGALEKQFNPGYYGRLDAAAQKRYLEKISLIGGVDPYEVLCWEDNTDKSGRP